MNMAKQNEATKLTAPHKTEGFRGYTLSELRQQRLVARVRMELLKEKMTYDAAEMFKSKLPPGEGKSSGVLGILNKGLRLLSYADIIALGFSMFRTGRNIIGFFRR